MLLCDCEALHLPTQITTQPLGTSPGLPRLQLAATAVANCRCCHCCYYFHCCRCHNFPTRLLPQVSAMAGCAAVKFYAKAAIVAVPLGVLQKRGPSFFSPALEAAKRNAINGLGMSLLNKVILEFASTYVSGPFASAYWWHNRLPNATSDTGDWQEFFVLRMAYGASAPVLVAFQAGQPAVTAEMTMNDAQAVASVSFPV